MASEAARLGSRLRRLAGRLGALLGEDAMLIGGVAVSVWGHERATRDIDFVCRLSEAETRKRLAAQGIATTVRRGSAASGDIPWVVRGTLDGFPFEVLGPVVSLDWDRAVVIPMPRGAPVRVVDLGGLIRLKLRAGGTKDLWDVAVLVLKHPEHLDAARNLAVAYRVRDRLDAWLDDPRLKAELAESRRAEKRAGREAASRPRGRRSP